MEDREDVLRFWLKDCTPKDWYAGSDALDARIKARFEPLLRKARAGHLMHWVASARGSLALLILTDQFSRNMYRGSPEAFASDPLARSVAKKAIGAGFDLAIPEPERQFFYMPLEHSENLCDQERAVRLIKERTQSAELLLHARVHRDIIRMFGRFPFRNAVLGRESSAAEKRFMESGGYGGLLNTYASAA